MSVHPRSEGDLEDSTSKRPRLSSSSSPSSSSTLINSHSVLTLHSHLFKDKGAEEGLFKVLAPTLGLKPAEEPQVGITEFVDSSLKSFKGIIKHRFTDFLVYEIGLDGEIVRLKDIKGPIPEKKQKNNNNNTKNSSGSSGDQQQQATTTKIDKIDSKNENVTPTTIEKVEPPLWNETVSSIFSPLLTRSKLEEFSKFVLSGSPHHKTTTTTATPESITFTTSPIEDKLQRGKFHQSVREFFGGKLLSAHKELPDSRDIVIEVNWAKGNLGKSTRRGGGGGGKKDNRGDEQELRESRALEQKKLSNLPPYIEFTLLKTNKESHDAISSLTRYFHVTTRELGLAGTKDKRAITVQRVSLKRGKKLIIEDVWRVARNGGSRGWVDRNIRIGDVEYSDKALELGMLKGNKFVVTLRDIDTDSISTIHSSMNSLRFNGFLNYYGMQRFGTAPIPTHLIGLALLRSEWELAVDLIMSERQGEQQEVTVARALWKQGEREEAKKLMPRRCTAERCIMEAYKKGNDKDHLGALSSIPKNLRLMYVHAWQSYIWNRLVSERVKLFGATKPVEGDLVYVGEGDEEIVDGKGDEDQEEEAQAVNKPNDPSSAESQQAYYISTSSLPKVRPLNSLDISNGTHSIYDVLLPMPGFAVTYPGGELGEVYKRVIKEDGIDPEKMWRKQKEYSLGGTYRKIIHKPSKVSYKLLISNSSAQDLAQSDEDVLLGKPLLEIKEFDEKIGLLEGESLNLQVELELGSSTYATMALREILKSRTSAANQKNLTKEMEGRLGVQTSGGDAPVSSAGETERVEGSAEGDKAVEDVA
ncbi:hypothetical protein JCM3765_007878 [Sporobolomyces pararoseus]